MGSNIVHQYFKKEFDKVKILVRVNPVLLKGTELTVTPDGKVSSRSLEFDEAIFEDLKVDGFSETGPMEFNLYESGLK